MHPINGFESSYNLKNAPKINFFEFLAYLRILLINHKNSLLVGLQPGHGGQNSHNRDNMHQIHHQKKQDITEVVPLPYALIQPNTVVIEADHTLFAPFAVDRGHPNGHIVAKLAVNDFSEILTFILFIPNTKVTEAEKGFKDYPSRL